MAITNINNIGKRTHLLNSVDYILQEGKIKSEENIISNCGKQAKDVVDAFTKTKEFFEKTKGRQAYHFILSFHPTEATIIQAREVAQKFCDQFLGIDYEYICALHDDTDHKHAHIIFNSVNRLDGYKYRYEKKDWERKIQPILNGICDEMRILVPEFTFTREKENKKGTSMAEIKVEVKQKDILYHDIDLAILKADSYSDFIFLMKKAGYEIREGYSKKNQEPYLSLKNEEMKKARRTSKLKEGYSLLEIKEKILSKKKEITLEEKRLPFKKRKFLQAYTPMTKVSKRQVRGYQATYIRRSYRVQRYFYGNAHFKESSYRQDIYRFGQLKDKCLFLMNKNIRTEEDLRVEIEKLKREVKNEASEVVKKNLRTAYQIKREIEGKRKLLQLQERQTEKNLSV